MENYNNISEYGYLAIDRVIEKAREIGIKYRVSDFATKQSGFDNINTLLETDDSVVIALWYDFARCGKLLKKKQADFLAYPECKNTNDGIFFKYSKNELLSYSKSENTDVDSEKLNKIIKKINVMLRMAEQTSADTEGEAIAASIMVQKLLKKYHLDMAEVVDTDTEKGKDIKELSVDVKSGGKWKYSLAETVARNYCCKVYVVNSNRFVFVGYESDSLIARKMFFYLFNVGNTLSNNYVRNKKSEGVNTKGLKETFCNGFQEGVKKALDESCKALMLVVQDDVSEKFEIITRNAKVINYKLNINDVNAFEEGLTEGRRAINSRYIEGEEE